MRRCFVLFQTFLKVGRTGRFRRAQVRHCGGLAAPEPLRDALPTWESATCQSLLGWVPALEPTAALPVDFSVPSR